MKIVTVLGTRPEIIRLSQIIGKIDQHSDHILVHTGQNFDHNLNEIFFEQMGVRKPDYFLNAKGNLGNQVGIILSGIEEIIINENPDKFLILGDTNSALSAITAKRMGIPVYHMEAGNRCYDDRVPEEVNRRIVDSCSDILMPYTERSRQNLQKEGFSSNRIFVTGNPILEVLNQGKKEIANSRILDELKLVKNGYFLVTLHRAENVDVRERLLNFNSAFELLQKKYKIPVIISTHPRTRSKLEKFCVKQDNPNIQYLPPFGLFDFVALEQNARVVLSDSGTVQEECCIFKIPNVTLRDVTERPETIECGSNILSGSNVDKILRCVEIVTDRKPDWDPPTEYLMENVSNTVIRILFGMPPLTLFDNDAITE
ncbi:MAG: UDP-N-acetylglucosamine 2-epimerase (non-hydrolyzing) [Anaerolineaceae bacterium]|nr:UDP-N-acetylglucosamine 2-epimerase (non-hydrolyzing) [Anaerolineaceae bacterium]